MRQIVYALGFFIYGSMTCIAYVIAFAIYIGVFITLITGVWGGWIWGLIWLFVGLGIAFLLVSLLSLPIRGLGVLLMYLARGSEWKEEVATTAEAYPQRIRNSYVSTLTEELKYNNVNVRRSAARIIRDTGDSSAIPALREALEDEDVMVRMNVIDALERIGPNAEGAIPALIKALEDVDTTVRRHAIRALGRLGPDAQDAIPALEELKESDLKLSSEASEAIENIKGGL